MSGHKMKKTVRLAQAVLASTLFVSSLAFSQTTATQITSLYAEPTPNPQLQTTTNPSIEITTSGEVLATNTAPPVTIPATPFVPTDGIQVNSTGAMIVLDPTIAGTYTAIKATATVGGVGSNGINILNGAGMNNLAVINVGSGAIIDTTTTKGAGIYINDTTATITNNGIINGGTSAIEVAAGGTNATVNNSGTGALLQGGYYTAAPTFLVDGNVSNGGTGLTLNNLSGAVINAINSNDAVSLNQNFTLLNNDATSTISSINGNAINIGPQAVAAITGDVENFGLVQATGSGAAIIVSGIYNGVINNNGGGVLQNTSNTAGGGVVVLSNSFNSFNNAGTIQETGTSGFLNAILVNGAAVGTVNNSGIIKTSNNAATIYLGGNLTGFNNSGSITGAPTAANEAVVLANANNISMINGFVNTGTITNTLAGGNAINFQLGGNNINIPLIQAGGTIKGNVLLSSNSSLVTPAQYALTMSGGTITGNVTSSSSNPSVLQLNGGTVTGTTTLGNVNGNIVNLAGTSLQALVGSPLNDTFNLSGGSFASLNGNGGADIINVTGTFTQTGPISKIPTINVQNKGIFTSSSSISADTTAFNINAGGVMYDNFNQNTPAAVVTIANNGTLQVNNGFTFSVLNATNSGGLSTQPGGVFNPTAFYTQTATGTYAPVMQSAAVYGQIQTPVTNINPNSFLAPSLNTGGVFLAPGTFFDVIKSGAPVTLPILVQPQSALVFFTEQQAGNNLRVTLGLKPIAAVAQGDIPQAVGTALDPLLFGGTNNPDLLALLGQLELLYDVTTLDEALLQLAPPYNYALPTSARISMNNAFDSVQQRLEELNGLKPITTDENYNESRDYELYNGVNYGDVNVIGFGEGHYGAWVKLFGTIYDQHKRNEVEGFLAESTGVAIGGDWRLTPQALVGAALSLSKVNTHDNTAQQDKIKLQTYQATLYGWFEFSPGLYLDSMLAVASEKYDTTRNMQIGTLSATAEAQFDGIHYGAQADLGYAFLTNENWFVAPYLRGRYTYLDIGDYSEKGAGGIGLNVRNQPLYEMIGGIGLRVAAKRDFVTAAYVPEASATLLYDFAGREQSMQSIFLGAPLQPFYTNSVKPQQLIQLYGLGITAYTSDGYVFTVKTNFEYRNELFGYNGYLELRYEWD